jgi:hypothetical protein
MTGYVAKYSVFFGEALKMFASLREPSSMMCVQRLALKLGYGCY